MPPRFLYSLVNQPLAYADGQTSNLRLASAFTFAYNALFFGVGDFLVAATLHAPRRALSFGARRCASALETLASFLALSGGRTGCTGFHSLLLVWAVMVNVVV